MAVLGDSALDGADPGGGFFKPAVPMDEMEPGLAVAVPFPGFLVDSWVVLLVHGGRGGPDATGFGLFAGGTGVGALGKGG